MMFKKLLTKMFLIGSVLGAVLTAGILVGCAGDSEPGDGADSGRMTASAGVSERGEGSGGEHGSGGEGGAAGGEEGSGATLAPDETFDMLRAGARLILSYDAASNSFTGTVENTTSNVLTQVRIEVHLSNGTELGPTTPMDLAPGEVVAITLPSTQASFTGWVAHAEVGGGEGSESGGGEGGGESSEAAMSSPIIPLGQSWNGTLGGLAVSARFDEATGTVHATVQNTLPQVLCYVQAEPHLKSGTRTVGELGPDVIGHLSPGQEATSSVAVASEPALAESPTTGTSFTWKCSTAVVPAPCPTRAVKALKAAVKAPAVSTVPGVKARPRAGANPPRPAAKRATVPPSRWMRPSTWFAAAPG